MIWICVDILLVFVAALLILLPPLGYLAGYVAFEKTVISLLLGIGLLLVNSAFTVIETTLKTALIRTKR
ncbi:MAG: hypothetical protein ACRD1X_03195 [Vicinamibacteria bacterium]